MTRKVRGEHGSRLQSTLSQFLNNYYDLVDCTRQEKNRRERLQRPTGDPKLNVLPTISSNNARDKLSIIAKEKILSTTSRGLSMLALDPALQKMALQTKDGSLGTYINSIYKICCEYHCNPSDLIQRFKGLERSDIQSELVTFNQTLLKANRLSEKYVNVIWSAFKKLLRSNGVEVKGVDKGFVCEQKSDKEGFGNEDVQKLYTACESDQSMLRVILFAESGARPNVLYKLRYGDILEKLRDGREEFAIKVLDKGNIRHWFIISRLAVKTINKILQDYAKDGIQIAENDPLICNLHDPHKPLGLGKTTLRTWFYRLLSRAGITKKSYTRARKHRASGMTKAFTRVSGQGSRLWQQGMEQTLI